VNFVPVWLVVVYAAIFKNETPDFPGDQGIAAF